MVLSVIDNLVKGASGQAVQNMNIMFGLPETTGLEDARAAAVKLKWLKRRFGLRPGAVACDPHCPGTCAGWHSLVVAVSVGGLVWIAYPLRSVVRRLRAMRSRGAQRKLR